MLPRLGPRAQGHRARTERPFGLRSVAGRLGSFGRSLRIPAAPRAQRPADPPAHRPRAGARGVGVRRPVRTRGHPSSSVTGTPSALARRRSVPTVGSFLPASSFRTYSRDTFALSCSGTRACDECSPVHHWMNPQAERFGGLEVDDELELRRLLDGKVPGLGTLENLEAASPPQRCVTRCRGAPSSPLPRDRVPFQRDCIQSVRCAWQREYTG
jgi:hypothetical protein